MSTLGTCPVPPDFFLFEGPPTGCGKIISLKLIFSKHLQAHDASVILKNSLEIPKLLYLLRTSQCSDNPLLRQFDDTLRTGLITILNVDISSDQWLQVITCRRWWSGNTECWDADTFCLFGFSCIHTPAPAIHTPRQPLDARRSVGGVYGDIMDRPGQLTKTLSANTTHPESLEWTSCSK